MTAMIVWQVLWVALPVTVAGGAHMVLVTRRRWEGLARPLDGGRTLHGRRLFGANKTWRGVLAMPLLGGIAGAALGAALGPWAARTGVAVLDYGAGPETGRSGLALGYASVNALLGLAYVLGELPCSFVKRQLDISPGSRGPLGPSWVAFLLADQLDSVVAALLVAALALGLPWRVAACGVLVLPAVHLAVTLALRGLRLKAAV